MNPQSRHKEIFHMLDHIFIYVAIAGSYTPIALSVIGGWQGLFLSLIHICLALQPAVDLREEVPGVGRAVYEDDPDLRVVHQQADQFAGRVPGPSDDSRADHFSGFSLRFWTL